MTTKILNIVLGITLILFFSFMSYRSGYYSGYDKGKLVGFNEAVDAEIAEKVNQRYEYIKAKADSLVQAKLSEKALEMLTDFKWSK